MSTEQNKAVVRRFIEEILNTMDIALVDELFAPDYVNHLMPWGTRGLQTVHHHDALGFPRSQDPQ